MPNCAEMMCKYAEKEGVQYYFGLNGHGNQSWLMGFEDTKVKPLRVRREDAAVHMADGYFRVTHEPQVATVTTGPGSNNILPGLAAANGDSSALIALCGGTTTQEMDKATIQEYYMHSSPDEWANSAHAFCKKVFFVIRPDTAVDLLSKGFAIAKSGRPGPVLLQVPKDIQFEELPEDLGIPDPKGRDSYSLPRPDGEAVARSVEVIRSSERPLIIVGGGAQLSDAGEVISSFALRFGIPVAHSDMGRGVISSDNPVYAGNIGTCGMTWANNLVKQSDLIIALGFRFNDFGTGMYSLFDIPNKAKLIHVDIDASEIGRNYPAEVGILADVKKFVEDLHQAMSSTGYSSKKSWMETLQRERKAWLETVQKDIKSDLFPMHYARIVWEMCEVFRDGIISWDTGFAQTYMPGFGLTNQPKSAFTNGHMAQMGFSTSAIIGAKLGRPDKPAITLTGDMSFLMNNYSVLTAVEYGIPVSWLVLNNAAVLIERQAMLAQYERACIVDYKIEKTGKLHNPDFAKLAEVYGAEGIKVESPSDLKHALERARSTDKPTVLDVPSSRDLMPWMSPGVSLPWWPTKWASPIKNYQNIMPR